MRRIPLALTCCLALLGTFAAPQIADACSCIKPPGPVAAASDAGAVFEAKIVSKSDFEKSFGDLNHKQKMHRYSVEVLRVWKGGDIAPSGTKIDIVTADNSAACGRIFEIGESYLVYATYSEGEFSDGLCSNTKKSADAAADFEALGEATGKWTAPAEGGDDGGDGGNGDEGDAPTEPAVNPFDRPADDGGAADDGAKSEGEGSSPAEPPPAEGSKRGCAVSDPGGPAGAGALGMLFGAIAWRRRRRR